MVRGKTVPVRALTDNLDHKITSFSIFTPSNREQSTPKTDQNNTALKKSTNNPTAINPHLSEIQQHIIDAIKKFEGSCKFEDIFQFVSRKWTGGKQKNTSSECRKSIQEVLDSMVCLFQKDHYTKEWTLCTTFNHQGGIDSDQPFLSGNHGIDDHSIQQQESTSMDNQEEIQLTDLQQLIAQTIVEHKGACHFDILHHQVLENWKGLRGRDGQPKVTDCKRAILASLSKNIRTQPLFKRANSTKHWWQLAEYNPFYTKELDNEAMRIEMIDEPLFKSKNDLGILSKHSKDDLRLTDLQIFVIEAIAESGGTASIDQITDRVSKNWGRLRRRDGSKYTTDCRRAVQASLANNSSTKPIFKRESKTKGFWGLGKRALEYLEMKGINISSESQSGGSRGSLYFHQSDTDPDLDGVELDESDDLDHPIRSSNIQPTATDDDEDDGDDDHHKYQSLPSKINLKTSPPSQQSSLSLNHRSETRFLSKSSSKDGVKDENDTHSGENDDHDDDLHDHMDCHESSFSNGSYLKSVRPESVASSSPCHSTSDDSICSRDSHFASSLPSKKDVLHQEETPNHDGNQSPNHNSTSAIPSKSDSSSECDDSGQSIFNDIFGDLSSPSNASNEHSGSSHDDDDDGDNSMDESGNEHSGSSSRSGSDHSEHAFEEDESSDTEDDDSQDDEFQNESELSSSDSDSPGKKSSRGISHHIDRKSTSRDSSSSSDENLSDDGHDSSQDHNESDHSMELEPQETLRDSETDQSDEDSSSEKEEIQVLPPTLKRRGRKKKTHQDDHHHTLKGKKNDRISMGNGSHLAAGGPNSPSLIQTLIKDSILNNNGSCSLDLIIKEVLSGISELPSEQKKSLQNGYSSLSALIESTLTSKASSAQFFRQDARNPNIWMLSRRGSRAWPIDSGDTLTDLQAEIVQIMALNGGKASWDTIVNEITMLNFTRKAGKARKIIKASLNANINDRPIFKRDKADNWMVADKKIQERVLKKYDGLLRKRKNFPEETELQPRKRR